MPNPIFNEIFACNIRTPHENMACLGACDRHHSRLGLIKLPEFLQYRGRPVIGRNTEVVIACNVAQWIKACGADATIAGWSPWAAEAIGFMRKMML